ncbi:peptidyl-prolyl cis-trans isomerase [Microaerobacter geothermalis]|uniref:peptidyl-prolyl cis-trans isomerase n=1 Tax=Microaerobacter geothermalis TaxID=674972 RepID=UPI001F226C11|nr:peptidyl-prolyl cis-trans isomerase [Microaerobacter geothermalis]MCF6094679.1 peptidyl-prolyl cis-trans isomerase [Microaerobacter geothermalis]
MKSGWMRGIIILLVFVLGLSIGYFLPDRKEKMDVPVASVGDEIITELMWLNQLKEDYGEQVLQDMIDRKVVFSEANRLGITVSDKEIEQEIQKMRKAYENDEQFLNSLKEQSGTTLEQLKEDMRYYLTWEKLATKDVVVSDPEIEEYYNNNLYLFQEPEKVHAWQIVVSTEEEAKQVIRELEEGTDFSTLAKERSMDLLTANQGGDLGFISLNDSYFDPSFLEVAFSLKEGEISSPIPVEKGFVILKVTEKVKERIIPLDEVKDTIRKEIALSQVPSLPQVLDQLRKQAKAQILINDNGK